MKEKLHVLTVRHFLPALLLAAGLAATVSAQYLISSRAGFVNLVEGKAQIQRQGDTETETLKATLGTQLRDSDRLKTAADTFAELLLNPGSYLRLGEKAEVVAVNTSLSAIRFDIVQGSVMVEVGEIDKKTPLEIGTPRGVVSIAKSGIYRFDVRGDEVGIGVRRGELFLGTRAELLAKKATKIKDGKLVRLTAGGAPEIAKLSPKVFDDFDVRSYHRAETLVAANYSLLSRSRRFGSLNYGWVFDPLMNTYTFLPRNYFYSSPYGFAFFRSWADCGYCSPFFYYTPGYSTGSQATSGSGTNQVPPRAVVGDGGHRTGTRLTVDPGRQIEPYSRPNTPVDAGTYSRFPDAAGYGARDIGTSRGVSPSSPSVAPVPAPSRDVGGGDRGSASGRGDVGGRRVQ